MLEGICRLGIYLNQRRVDIYHPGICRRDSGQQGIDPGMSQHRPDICRRDTGPVGRCIGRRLSTGHRPGSGLRQEDIYLDRDRDPDLDHDHHRRYYHLWNHINFR